MMRTQFEFISSSMFGVERSQLVQQCNHLRIPGTFSQSLGSTAYTYGSAGSYASTAGRVVGRDGTPRDGQYDGVGKGGLDSRFRLKVGIWMTLHIYIYIVYIYIYIVYIYILSIYIYIVYIYTIYLYIYIYIQYIYLYYIYIIIYYICTIYIYIYLI